MFIVWDQSKGIKQAIISHSSKVESQYHACPQVLHFNNAYSIRSLEKILRRLINENILETGVSRTHPPQMSSAAG
ncbi:hypothetical protein TNCV_3955631 [Trichonephila clavipes]|nr:hypothetical protein TNCV_3955631 [Trichonephila clavipes]